MSVPGREFDTQVPPWDDQELLEEAGRDRADGRDRRGGARRPGAGTRPASP